MERQINLILITYAKMTEFAGYNSQKAPASNHQITAGETYLIYDQAL